MTEVDDTQAALECQMFYLDRVELPMRLPWRAVRGHADVPHCPLAPIR